MLFLIHQMTDETHLHYDSPDALIIRHHLGWEGYGLYVALMNFADHYGYMPKPELAKISLGVEEDLIYKIYDLVETENLEIPNKENYK